MKEWIEKGGFFLEKYERCKKTGLELSGDLSSAVLNYTKVVELGCLDAEVFANRAAAYNWLNRHEEAFADICRAIELDPDNGVYLCNRGIAYADKEDWERAFFDFFDAAKICPDEMPTIKNTAQIIYRYRFQPIINDEFYIVLQKITAHYGKDIFGKDMFRPLLLDYANGEHKNEINILLDILKQGIIKEFDFQDDENPETARKRVIQIVKDEYRRITDILCCLLLYDSFFEVRRNG